MFADQQSPCCSCYQARCPAAAVSRPALVALSRRPRSATLHPGRCRHRVGQCTAASRPAFADEEAQHAADEARTAAAELERRLLQGQAEPSLSVSGSNPSTAELRGGPSGNAEIDARSANPAPQRRLSYRHKHGSSATATKHANQQRAASHQQTEQQSSRHSRRRGEALQDLAAAAVAADHAGTAASKVPAADSKERPADAVTHLVRQLAELEPRASSAEILAGMQLDMFQICSVLTELAKLQQPDRALATFAWFEQSPDYSIDHCLLYTRMISILGRHQRHTRAALRIFDRMQKRRIKPDLMCFNAAINVAGKAQQYDRAQRLFNQLLPAGFQPNVYSYTSLIAACQHVGRWQDAWRIFEDMQAAGVAPNVKTVTTLMSASTRAGQWHLAIKAFQEMDERGLQPDVVAYNSAITACARARAWEKAWALFGNMKRLRIQPSTRSYNALLSACERAGQPDRALEVWANMQRAANNGQLRGRPTAVTFNTLLLACAKAGRFDETVRLHGEMLRAGLLGDVYTLTALLTACERVGKWRLALRIQTDFATAGVQPNLQHHNCLLSAFSRAAEWEKAMAKLREMQAQPGTGPDKVSYASVIAACQRAQQHSQALELLDQMLAAELVPDVALLSSLISSCERKQDWRRAVQLFETMKELDVDAPSLSMAARQVLYAWPYLLEVMPPQLVTAAQASIGAGRKARQWLDRR